MTCSRALRALRLTALGLAAATCASAQSPGIEWGGRAFLDYRYLLASDAPDDVGDNTFDIRRVYLTADATLSEDFQTRARLEANSRSTTAQGRPAPFLKDAWVRWRYAGAGHRVTLGIQPPPLFDVSEAVWGYRSLDRTVIDRARFRDSRDLGLRADGPIVPGLHYAMMVGNGNGVQAETGGDRGKSVYGQLVYAPGEVIRATVGVDRRSDRAAAGPDETSLEGSAFVGAVTDRFRGGVEAFVVRSEVGAGETEDGYGVSVFGAASVSDRTALVARYDFIEAGASRIGDDEHYVLGAVAYRPIPSVALMPNVVATMPAGAEAEVVGRVTVDVRF